MDIVGNFPIFAVVILVILIGSIYAALEVGRRIGVRRKAENPEATSEGLGSVEGAIFGLMGLLIAFTFSGAAGRFEDRRHLLVEETNDIGTAYLRIDLLPADVQPKLRELYRRYTDSRIAVYHNTANFEIADVESERTVALQDEIWKLSVEACKSLNNPATTSLVLNSLNAMIDITTTQAVAVRTHPPTVVYVLLLVILLASSLLAGFGMSGGTRRNWLHVFSFAVIMGISTYVIIDFEFPRVGFIRIDSVDKILVDLRSTMK